MNPKQWLFPLLVLLVLTANFRWNIVGSAWHFPFMLLAFVLMGVFMKQFITNCFEEKKTRKEFFK